MERLPELNGPRGLRWADSAELWTSLVPLPTSSLTTRNTRLAPRSQSTVASASDVAHAAQPVEVNRRADRIALMRANGWLSQMGPPVSDMGDQLVGRGTRVTTARDENLPDCPIGR